jgi:phage nucleotide-binding protein
MARPKAITSVQETPSEGKRNWLIYAPSGVGKTVVAGTAPNGLFLTVVAAGTESAKAMGSDADEWVCDSWAELQEAFDWLKNGGYKEYEWAMLDSLTEMQELCWADQLEEAKANNSSRSIYQPAIQDYAIVDNKIKRLVDAFNRLPINVLYTAQQMDLGIEDEDGDDITMRLPMIGRAKNGAPLSNLICGKMTLVGLLGVIKDSEDYETRLATVSGTTWMAKDRHDTFGSYVDHPNIAEMAAAVDKRQAEGKKSSGSKAPAKASSGKKKG